jgi:hypothetical protein
MLVLQRPDPRDRNIINPELVQIAMLMDASGYHDSVTSSDVLVSLSWRPESFKPEFPFWLPCFGQYTPSRASFVSSELHFSLWEPFSAPPRASFALPQETKTRKSCLSIAFHGHLSGPHARSFDFRCTHRLRLPRRPRQNGNPSHHRRKQPPPQVPEVLKNPTNLQRRQYARVGFPNLEVKCERGNLEMATECINLSEKGTLLQNRYEPIAVNERLRLCFTLSIAERPCRLGSRVVRMGPAPQIAVEFEDLSRTERTVLRQITVSTARSDAACGSFG